MYKADDIKVLDSLVVAVVSDFRNHLCLSSLYLFFINISSLALGPELYRIFEMWTDKGFVFLDDQFFVLVLEIAVKSSSTLLTV